MVNLPIQLGAVSQESFVYTSPDSSAFANSEANAWPQITFSLNSAVGLYSPCLPPTELSRCSMALLQNIEPIHGRRGGQQKCWMGKAAHKIYTCCQSEAKAYVSLLQIFSLPPR